MMQNKLILISEQSDVHVGQGRHWSPESPQGALMRSVAQSILAEMERVCRP